MKLSGPAQVWLEYLLFIALVILYLWKTRQEALKWQGRNPAEDNLKDLVFGPSIGVYVIKSFFAALPLLYLGFLFVLVADFDTKLSKSVRPEKFGDVVVVFSAVVALLVALTSVYSYRAIRFLLDRTKLVLDQTSIRLIRRGKQTVMVLWSEIESVGDLIPGREITLRLFDGRIVEIPILQSPERLLTPIVQRMLRRNPETIQRRDTAAVRWIFVSVLITIIFVVTGFWLRANANATGHFESWKSLRIVFGLDVLLFGGFAAILLSRSLKGKRNPFQVDDSKITLRGGREVRPEDIQFATLGSHAATVELKLKAGETISIQERQVLPIYRSIVDLIDKGRN